MGLLGYQFVLLKIKCKNDNLEMAVDTNDD